MSATTCPFIALATDSGKRLSGANAAHACFAQRPSQPIELDHQERLCLTATFSSCTLFVAWAAREAAQAISTAAPPAVGSDAWSTSQGVSVDALAAASRGEGEQPLDSSSDGTIWSLAAASQQPLSHEEEERVRVVPLHQRRTLEDEVPRAMIRLPRRLSNLRSFAAFILLLGVALFAAPSIFKGVGALVSGLGSEPTPVASATATPEASPTPEPTPEQVIYTIKSGDTLFDISQQFQISVDVILGANPEVTDPGNLKIGQQLIIPTVIPDVVISPSP
jgi:LysM repeat protein